MLAAALVLLPVILSAGCTSDTGPAPAATTPVPVTIITPAPTTRPEPVVTATVVPDSGAVQVMPSAQQVNLDLTKDRPTSRIILSYQGGPGEMFTQKISLRVYTSDTVYQDYVMRDGKKPLPGDEVIAPGTRGGDRCVVFVQSAGTTYKVIDEKVYAAGEYRV